MKAATASHWRALERIEEISCADVMIDGIAADEHLQHSMCTFGRGETQQRTPDTAHQHSLFPQAISPLEIVAQIVPSIRSPPAACLGDASHQLHGSSRCTVSGTVADLAGEISPHPAKKEGGRREGGLRRGKNAFSREEDHLGSRTTHASCSTNNKTLSADDISKGLNETGKWKK